MRHVYKWAVASLSGFAAGEMVSEMSRTPADETSAERTLKTLQGFPVFVRVSRALDD